MIKNIDNLNLEELKILLKQVKDYKDLKFKLGKRGIDLFKRNLENKDLYIVEYFGDTQIEEVYDFSKKVYKELFNSEVDKSQIDFIKSSEIKGGIKVYKNDFMVDVSFSKIEKLLK